MALGARRSEVVAMILRETLVLVLAGIALGIPAVLASARITGQFVYGLSPNDPATILGVSAILMGVALLAGFVPALRASKVDPVIALHAE
jgi:ABC-type antimicrobial peptide transport system permease subunit